MLTIKYTPKHVATLLMGAIMAKKVPRSAWDKGVRDYAIWYILGTIALDGDDTERQHWDIHSLRELILNGAKDYQRPNDEYRAWVRYSEGGCALIWNIDIAKKLLTPAKFEKEKKAIDNDTSDKNWCHIQAGALYQAAQLIYETFNQMTDQE